MKKIGSIVLSAVLAFSLSACGNKPANNAGGSGSDSSAAPSASAASESPTPAAPVTLKVGATAAPHAEILKQVKPMLEKEGVILEIKEFNDYVQPNVQVNEKQLDANFFQHVPYMEDFNTKRSMKLVKVVGVHVEPMGAYSQKVKKIEELKDGAKVAIPNDPTNEGRALALLEKAGLIKLKEGVGISGTAKDVVENKKNLKFTPMEAAMLPRNLGQVDLSVINTNYALTAKLVPTKDALIIEGSDSPYVNVLTAREDNKDSEAIQKLAKALNSPEVKKFIEDNYKGSIVPAF